MDDTRREKRISRLKKCLALSASPEPHEAAAALRQARALMDKHGISADDVLASEAGFAEVRAGALSRPANWEAALAGRVGLVFGCRVIFSRTARRR